jgi:5-methylcytosine-specific restriction endonuclease McrA
MNLWLTVPYCSSCAASDVFLCDQLPDISGRHWRDDLSCTLGEETFRRIKREIRKNKYFAIICKKCRHELRPWKGNEIWIVNYHLEEHYDIPLETPGKKSPSRKLRNKIIELYDRRCFGCPATSKDKELHIDHIIPESKGGDSAFRNLQPLCTDCGEMKGNDLPDEVDVYSDIYFGPYPSDGYEGLFW